jgi:ketosteroid isomerase-like protein
VNAAAEQTKCLVTAETVVRGMYDAINRRDVAAALEFVDDDILYEDFNFPAPFQGKAAVKKLFEESCDGIPDDMLFIVDECTDGGGIGVGMTWYVVGLYKLNPVETHSLKAPGFNP